MVGNLFCVQNFQNRLNKASFALEYKLQFQVETLNFDR